MLIILALMSASWSTEDDTSKFAKVTWTTNRCASDIKGKERTIDAELTWGTADVRVFASRANYGARKPHVGCTPAGAPAAGTFPEPDARDIVLFVHGFKKSLQTAVRMGGRLQHRIDDVWPTLGKDARPKPRVVVFSWPSRNRTGVVGGVRARRDLAAATDPRTQEALQAAISELREPVQTADELLGAPRRVWLVAHSMGTQLAVPVAAANPEALTGLTLIAGNIGAEAFWKTYAPALNTIPVNIYTSDCDGVLKRSRTFRPYGNDGAPRLGESMWYQTLVPGPSPYTNSHVIDAQRCDGGVDKDHTKFLSWTPYAKDVVQSMVEQDPETRQLSACRVQPAAAAVVGPVHAIRDGDRSRPSCP